MEHDAENTTVSNETLFERAKQVLPGGVNSPVRAFLSVGGTPYFVDRAAGARRVLRGAGRLAGEARDVKPEGADPMRGQTPGPQSCQAAQ